MDSALKGVQAPAVLHSWQKHRNMWRRHEITGLLGRRKKNSFLLLKNMTARGKRSTRKKTSTKKFNQKFLISSILAGAPPDWRSVPQASGLHEREHRARWSSEPTECSMERAAADPTAACRPPSSPLRARRAPLPTSSRSFVAPRPHAAARTTTSHDEPLEEPLLPASSLTRNTRNTRK